MIQPPQQERQRRHRETLETHLDRNGPWERVFDEHMATVQAGGSAAHSLRVQVLRSPGTDPVIIATQTHAEGGTLINLAEDYVSELWRLHAPDLGAPPRVALIIVGDDADVLAGDDDQFDVVSEPYFADARPFTVADPNWQAVGRDIGRALRDAGADLGRGYGYEPPPPEPPFVQRFAVVPVRRLPTPHPFRQAQCMARGVHGWRRAFRHFVPSYRRPRSCCWYHQQDWPTALQHAERILVNAAAAQIPDEELDDHVVAAARALPQATREAVLSIFRIPIVIGERRVLRRKRGYYTNGQHRSQAIIESGARRVVVDAEIDRGPR